MGKIIDITGQKFGFLTVLKSCRVKDRFGWQCQCDCGKIIEVESGNLRTGKVQSCGCQRNNLIATKLKKDLTGKNIGYLTVIGPTDQRSNGSIVWECRCVCGNICYIPTSNLSRNHTSSCGCQKYILSGKKSRLKILGKKFGKLTVIKELEPKNGESVWQCQCECGQFIDVIGWHLTKGMVQSCGCLCSKGEIKIKKILEENNIPFIQQKTFDSCLSKSNFLLKFDFFINNEYLLEYDGEQHFLESPRGYYTEERIQKIKENDKIKEKWCKENNIPLIRIKYTQFDNLSLDDLRLKEF